MSNIKLEDIKAMSDEDIENLTLEDHEELEKQKKEKEHIKHKANLKTNSQDLRSQVMKHGVSMIEKVQTNMLGNGEQFNTNQAQAYEMLWPVITDIISKTEDLKIIEAKNASEVINAVSKGKLSLKDAAAMMALLKEQVTIEELPKLLERLEQFKD